MKTQKAFIRHSPREENEKQKQYSSLLQANKIITTPDWNGYSVRHTERIGILEQVVLSLILSMQLTKFDRTEEKKQQSTSRTNVLNRGNKEKKESQGD